MDEVKTSPVSKSTMDFPAAMRKVIDGNRISRLDETWKKDGTYGALVGQFLTCVKNDGTSYTWAISDADMHATDWIVVSTTN